jgi:hypothetical protein
MKKCTYCGKEQPDEAMICPFDQQALEPLIVPLAKKTDQELLAMFESVTDYLPETLNQAADELWKRKIDVSHLWKITRPPAKVRYRKVGGKIGGGIGVVCCLFYPNILSLSTENTLQIFFTVVVCGGLGELVGYIYGLVIDLKKRKHV